MAAKMPGKAFEHHMRASMQLAGWFPERLPDHPNQHVLSTGDLMGEMPDGRHVFVECKARKVPRFSRSGITFSEHDRTQLEHLARKAREWPNAFIGVAVELREEQNGRAIWRAAWMLDVLQVWEHLEGTGAKGVNREWLSANAWECAWLGNGIYDLGGWNKWNNAGSL